jgi:hypothetical protein
MRDCASPIALASVVDYWVGEHQRADELEEHLMSCATCSATTARFAAIAHGVRTLVRRGGVALVLTPALLARLEQDGVRIRHHHVDPGGRTACTAGPEDELVAMWLTGDFRPGERVDVVIADAPVVSKRLEDVPVDCDRGRLVFVEPGATIRLLPAHRATIRLLGVTGGAERTIGEYTLDHEPWATGRR